MCVLLAIIARRILDSTSCEPYPTQFPEIVMIAFEVKDMTCGHCVNAITQALTAVDSAAEVRIDLAQHRVEVAATSAEPAILAAAIRDAGYTPVAL
ncbi:MAG: heavy-metal-associated domain-containing protein [Rhizobacter sp.]